MKKVFLLVIIIAAPIFFFIRWSRAGEDVKKICDSANGVSVVDIVEIVEKMGLRFGSEAPSDNAKVIIHSPRNMGRVTCFLTFRNGAVIDAKFSEMD